MQVVLHLLEFEFYSYKILNIHMHIKQLNGTTILCNKLWCKNHTTG
jgi:hypothetical protein